MRHTVLRSLVGVTILSATLDDTVAAEPLTEPEWLPVKQLVVNVAAPRLVVLDGIRRVEQSPRPCVCVRGLFPLSEQIAQLVESAGVDQTAARERVQIVNFKLQRQSLAASTEIADDPMWETVSLDMAGELLNASSEFDDDVVSAEAKHAVFTMPLPKQADGSWGTVAGHPDSADNGPPSLLFRYLDFDVKREHYYRYRVKLIVRNPHVGAVASDPFISLGDTRATPWSAPSPAILVQTSPE